MTCQKGGQKRAQQFENNTDWIVDGPTRSG